jgi:hypothetical protein
VPRGYHPRDGSDPSASAALRSWAEDEGQSATGPVPWTPAMSRVDALQRFQHPLPALRLQRWGPDACVAIRAHFQRPIPMSLQHIGEYRVHTEGGALSRPTSFLVMVSAYTVWIPGQPRPLQADATAVGNSPHAIPPPGPDTPSGPRPLSLRSRPTRAIKVVGPPTDRRGSSVSRRQATRRIVRATVRQDPRRGRQAADDRAHPSWPLRSRT